MRRVIAALLCTMMCAAVVEAAFDVSTDHRPVFFGLMQLGEDETLAQFGTYHHQLTVTSNNGRSWYLKISVLTPLSSGAETIPLDQFQWELVSTTGNGTIAHPHAWTPFSLIPEIVYFSGAGEASGTAVSLQFRYRLQVPQAQVSGIYQTTIRFTLTEIL